MGRQPRPSLELKRHPQGGRNRQTLEGLHLSLSSVRINHRRINKAAIIAVGKVQHLAVQSQLSALEGPVLVGANIQPLIREAQQFSPHLLIGGSDQDENARRYRESRAI
jgi:hypothetical protein